MARHVFAIDKQDKEDCCCRLATVVKQNNNAGNKIPSVTIPGAADVLDWVKEKFGKRTITAGNTYFHIDRLEGA